MSAMQPVRVVWYGCLISKSASSQIRRQIFTADFHGCSIPKGLGMLKTWGACKSYPTHKATAGRFWREHAVLLIFDLD